MFQDLQDVISHVGKESAQSINRLKNNANRRRTSTEDKKEDDDSSSSTTKEWRVKLPSDELDKFMWGTNGIPPPASPEPSKYQKNWAASSSSASDGRKNKDEITNESNKDATDNNIEEDLYEEQQYGKNDNILSALENTDQKQPPPPPSPPPEDKILLEDIVWKQRSGFGKYSFGLLSHEWEQRRVVLFESGILKYYALQKDMEGVKYDPSRAVDPNKSPWVYDVNQEARGVMDLMVRSSQPENSCSGSGSGTGGDNANNAQDGGGGNSPSIAAHSTSSFDFGESIHRLGNLVPNINKKSSRGEPSNVGGVTVQGRERNHGDPGPTPFEIDIIRNDNNEMWRFCFQSQPMQIEWLTMLKSMASQHGDNDNDGMNADACFADGLDNHGFQPGDHIIRWEMLPVLYPIQIHGIVLEAGKNCVIIADFGLASYDNQRASGGSEGLTTLTDDDQKGQTDNSHDVIMQAWENIKPKEKKRLNVIVVTNPKEIRKWSKINYGSQVEKESPVGFLSSFLPGGKSKVSPKNNNQTITEHTESVDDGDDKSVEKSKEDVLGQVSVATQDDAFLQPAKSTANNEQQQLNCDKDNILEGAPEWIQPGYRPRKRTGSSSSTVPLTNDGQSVFSIDHPEPKQNELPKSDSAKLVLARTHFILEHEDLLPPYHVFYSNSECIAVWCKTGRWSTLQAAVYLVSSSVGFGKSATMLTISVAAAHAILIPALAVGGLAVVGAPLLFLRKSQEKWEETTMSLTERFWAYAEPEVFVEAIEYWAKMGKS